jgi:hypothetical protein
MNGNLGRRFLWGSELSGFDITNMPCPFLRERVAKPDLVRCTMRDRTHGSKHPDASQLSVKVVPGRRARGAAHTPRPFCVIARTDSPHTSEVSMNDGLAGFALPHSLAT